jgi:Replication initiator protein A
MRRVVALKNLKVEGHTMKDLGLRRIGQIDTLTETNGRDEMNLAEFPITLLTDRSPRDQKTLCYEDAHGKLLITGSDAYGLPTAADADVIVALMQLTKIKNHFTDATVPFSRYELLKILNWPDTGRFYKRLAESLYRWSTTSLHYQGTWWDNHKKTNVQVVMHILESIVLVDRGRGDGPHSLPASEFTWNKIFLESCQANNLKNLDLGIYFALDHPSSKRLYRFLDKRFYRGRNDWTFDLREIAFERVGLSRNYDGNAAKIREKLQPALEELEKIGFLEPMTKEERYEKQGRDWTIRLVKKGSLASQPAPSQAQVQAVDKPTRSESPSIEQELIRRGVTAAKAERLAREYPAEVIAGKVEVFDWLAAKGDKRIAKSPAGYLVKSIEEDYAVPQGFVSPAERRRREEARRAQEREKAEQQRREREQAARDAAQRQAVDAYLKRLTPAERQALEAEVLARADAEARQCYEEAPGRLRATVLLNLVREHVAQELERGAIPAG